MADTSPNRYFPPRYFPSGYFGSGGQDPGAMRASLSGSGTVETWITYAVADEVDGGSGGKPKKSYAKIVSAHQLITQRINQIWKIKPKDKERVVKAVEAAGINPAPLVKAEGDLRPALMELDRQIADIRSRISALKSATERNAAQKAATPPVARRTERSDAPVVDDAIRKEIALLRARRDEDERLAAEMAEAARLAAERRAMLMQDEEAVLLLLIAA